MASISQIAKREPQEGEDPRLVQANKLYQTGVLLIHGRKKFVDKAIKCIQRAITIVDNDYKYWQLLGEAYYLRGSLNPAINCFMKSLVLAEEQPDGGQDSTCSRRNEDCIYSRLRMSDIRLSVGHLDEASSGYAAIIASDPTNVAALIGLSKTQLQIARSSFSSGLVKSGHFHCTKALEYSMKAIKLSPHLCITWKNASDCCLIQFIYGQRGEFQTKIEESFPTDREESSTVLSRRSCVELAQKFLCKALSIEPFDESGCLWHNLGISLYLKGTLTQKESERDILLRRSMKCLIKALSCDPTSSQIKNSIGVVAYHLNLLNTAQNFLIRSIQSNRSTSEIQFSNLGYMYLQKGEFRMAEVSFSRCQAEEPLYSRSWLGNALLLEQKNLDNFALLRHCYKLENNYESQLMFATKVTTLPSTQEYWLESLNALDGMCRMIDYDTESLVANNTLALLFERCKYYEQARRYLEKAHKLSPRDSRVIFNNLRLKRNSGCQIGCKIDQADSDLINEAEKLTNAGNRSNLLNYIFYLFKNEDYKNATSKINKYMERNPHSDVNNKISAQILLGLSSKAMQKDYKSWLFKNVIDSEDSDAGCLEALVNLICLMILGSASNDDQLVEQTSGDLAKRFFDYISSKCIRTEFSTVFYSQEGYWIRLALFSSIFCLKDRGKLIRPLVALFPAIAELWLYYGLVQMFKKSKEQASAIFCIKRATLIDSTLADIAMTCDLLLCLLTPSSSPKSTSRAKPTSSLPVDSNERRQYLCKAIFKYPNYAILWRMLNPGLFDSACSSSIQLNNKSSSHGDECNVALYNLAIDHLINVVLD